MPLLLLIGCGGGPATMTVRVDPYTCYGSSNGIAKLHVSGLEPETFRLQCLGYDPETGKHAYHFPGDVVENLTSGVYTGVVMLGSNQGGLEVEIGACTCTVDAENQVANCVWTDGRHGGGGI